MSRVFPRLSVTAHWPRLAAVPLARRADVGGLAPPAPGSRPPPAPPLSPDASTRTRVLAPGDPTLDPDALLARLTPVGLTEQALLLALNERDEHGLREFPGFGPKVVKKILEFRRAERFLSSLDELVRVPLIGPTRFARLVGRESLFFTRALHSTLRVPAVRAITLGDLQPLLWPAPGIPRVFLGTSAHGDAERATAAAQRWRLQAHRIGVHVLFLHANTPSPSGWAARLVHALPRDLRRSLLAPLT